MIRRTTRTSCSIKKQQTATGSSTAASFHTSASLTSLSIGTGPRSSIRRVRWHTRSITTGGGGRGRRARSSGSSTTAGRSPRGPRSTFEERPKPLWYALRRAFAPRNLVFATEDGILSVVLINDTDEPWRGELALSREQLDGEIRATVTVLVDVEPRTATPIALPDALSHPKDRTAEIVVARIEGVTRVHTFVEDIALGLEADPLDVQVEPTHDGYAVSATARTLARDITLLADRAAADATVDDGLVTLTAGQSATFRVRTKASELQQTLDRPPVLRTANDLQHTKTGVRRT